MDNEVIRAAQQNASRSIPPMVLTPSNAGIKAARILAAVNNKESMCTGAVCVKVAETSGKLYPVTDFNERISFLVATGHLEETGGRVTRTERGTALYEWIKTAKPELLRHSRSENVGPNWF